MFPLVAIFIVWLLLNNSWQPYVTMFTTANPSGQQTMQQGTKSYLGGLVQVPPNSPNRFPWNIWNPFGKSPGTSGSGQ